MRPGPRDDTSGADAARRGEGSELEPHDRHRARRPHAQRPRNHGRPCRSTPFASIPDRSESLFSPTERWLRLKRGTELVDDL